MAPGQTNGTVDGAEHPISPIEAFKDKPVAYALSKLPYKSPRRIKVIIVGGGASGLSFARQVETGELRNMDLSLYEKNAGLGGTWFENTYPGCACDIPSHAYLVWVSPSGTLS
jgi:hypothetical protein